MTEIEALTLGIKPRRIEQRETSDGEIIETLFWPWRKDKQPIIPEKPFFEETIPP